MPGRASARAALETRRNVLRAAADLASLEGLDNITIGRVAETLSMSRSGVIGHFESREHFQLETVEFVFADFRARVWDPVQRFKPGLERLLAACEKWTEYAADPGFPGGCLLTQVTYDYDGRQGPVHARILEGRDLWRKTLRADLAAAVTAGEVPEALDVETTIFGLESLAAFVTPARLLYGDKKAGERAVRSMRNLIVGPDSQA